MIKIEDKNKCCGCSACESVCGKLAITMQSDSMGFLYPLVDEELCVDCGLCEKVCAFNSEEIKASAFTPLFYAARLKNIDDLIQSQSGGVFYALAQYVINNKGVVYGVGYDNHFYVRHKRATSIEECKEFRGSKYVQSDLTGIYKQVREDLKNGKIVLFSGTPCQTAGLNSFIPNSIKERLILVDIICHGVPSPRVWKDYVSYLEKKENDTIIRANFRDKESFGWRSAKATFIFSKHPNKKRWYYGKIYNTNTFRESCDVCPYCNTIRPSDITIGDFWNKSIPKEFDDNKGCSCIIVNTKKGKNLFDEISNEIHFKQMTKEESLQYNLCEATHLDANRFKFEEEYTNNGFFAAMSKYADLGWRKQLRLRVGHVKRIIYNKIKNLL